MTFVVPVVMVGHLREGKPLLKCVGEVKATRHAAVLLKALQYAEQVREPESLSVQRDQDLREHVAHDRVSEIVEPVIFVGIAREWVFRPVMDRVDFLPQIRDVVQRAVAPVHAERHDVVIQDQPQEAFLYGLRRLSIGKRRWILSCRADADQNQPGMRKTGEVRAHETRT
eukprot:COSAG02_NODE_1145_length_14241_cov_3.363951_7_plen_170_part_00